MTAGDGQGSIEGKRQDLLRHADIVCYDSYGVTAIMALADDYVLAVLEEAERCAEELADALDAEDSGPVEMISLRQRIAALRAPQP